VLDEQDCVEKLTSYTRQDWKPLFTLIPKIENTTVFGRWTEADKSNKGVIHSPCCKPSAIVSQFLETVYAIPIIIGFDWAAWEEGRNMAKDVNIAFDSIELIAKCKLITAIVRNDRFCEGALVAAFESGLILNILKSMKKEVSDNKL